MNVLDWYAFGGLVTPDRVRTGFGKFWKVMEVENAIFQALESFGKEMIFIMAMEKLWIFVGKNC